MTRTLLRRTTAAIVLTALAAQASFAQERVNPLRPKARPGQAAASVAVPGPKAGTGNGTEALAATGVQHGSEAAAIAAAATAALSANPRPGQITGSSSGAGQNGAAAASLFSTGTGGSTNTGASGLIDQTATGLQSDAQTAQTDATLPDTILSDTTSDAASMDSQGSEIAVARLSNPMPIPLRPQARPEGLTQVAGRCLDPETIRDKDVQRNLNAFFADSDLCITQESFSEHGRNWHLVIVTNKANRRGPIWAVLHDNEDSAFNAGLYSVSRYGGKMVAVEAGEQRSHRGQDPNRNFGTNKKITGPCRAMSPKPSPGFTRAISKHFKRGFPVLTMHSNENGHAATGGGGHISAARSSATMRGFMASNPKRGLSDEDNAILTAGTMPYDANKDAQKLVKHFGQRGINVIYEHVRPQKNDCSFSFHTLLNNMGDYYNIEVEHGHTEDQKSILDALMVYLKVDPLY